LIKTIKTKEAAIAINQVTLFIFFCSFFSDFDEFEILKYDDTM